MLSTLQLIDTDAAFLNANIIQLPVHMIILDTTEKLFLLLLSLLFLS